MEQKQNLTMTVYRQAVRDRTEGELVYKAHKGEDARPYVGDTFLFVADGLGGNAAMRHTKFSPSLFETDKAADTLFGGVEGYEEYVTDPLFRAYVEESFEELRVFEQPEYRERYWKNRNNLKKGGYFGSRIASAVFYKHMTTAPYKDGAVFDELLDLSGEKREERLEELGRELAASMYADIRTVASKEVTATDGTVGPQFFYESSLRGLALLGTTLAAALYREDKEKGKLHVLYFAAGDSRPYVWDEKDGLRQTLPDQEGEDGAMTNYIRANDAPAGEIPFSIECRYYCFKTPCVVFTASDGIFDSCLFETSPLELEKLVLTAIRDEESLKAAGKAIDTIFDTGTNGAHDDSSTLALKAFGYADLDELKKAAADRLAKCTAPQTVDFDAEGEAAAREAVLAIPAVQHFATEFAAYYHKKPTAPHMKALRDEEATLRADAKAAYEEACTLLLGALRKEENAKYLAEWQDHLHTVYLIKFSLDELVAIAGKRPSKKLEAALAPLVALLDTKDEVDEKGEDLDQAALEAKERRIGEAVKAFADTLRATDPAAAKKWFEAVAKKCESVSVEDRIELTHYFIENTSRKVMGSAVDKIRRAVRYNQKAEALEKDWAKTCRSYDFATIMADLYECLEEDESPVTDEADIALVKAYWDNYHSVAAKADLWRYQLSLYETAYMKLIEE